MFVRCAAVLLAVPYICAKGTGVFVGSASHFFSYSLFPWQWRHNPFLPFYCDRFPKFAKNSSSTLTTFTVRKIKWIPLQAIGKKILRKSFIHKWVHASEIFMSDYMALISHAQCFSLFCLVNSNAGNEPHKQQNDKKIERNFIWQRELVDISRLPVPSLE